MLTNATLLSSISETPIHNAIHYHLPGNLYVKLEGEQPTDSIKHRAAVFMLEAARRQFVANKPVIVESTSGNLGFSLGKLAPNYGFSVICIVDDTLPTEKIERLSCLCEVIKVSADIRHDARSTRIARAAELGAKPGFIWINQYANKANYSAHYESTGPEIWKQMNQKLNWLVCSIGSGGTACGLGAFFKEVSPNVSVVAVEPYGSTIFGTHAGPFLSVGAGLNGPSKIVKMWGQSLAGHAQVPDDIAISECLLYNSTEGVLLGVTSGACLAVARQIANDHPDHTVLAIAADFGMQYREFFKNAGVIERLPLSITKL